MKNVVNNNISFKTKIQNHFTYWNIIPNLIASYDLNYCFFFPVIGHRFLYTWISKKYIFILWKSIFNLIFYFYNFRRKKKIRKIVWVGKPICSFLLIEYPLHKKKKLKNLLFKIIMNFKKRKWTIKFIINCNLLRLRRVFSLYSLRKQYPNFIIGYNFNITVPIYRYLSFFNIPIINFYKSLTIPLYIKNDFIIFTLYSTHIDLFYFYYLSLLTY